jgi:hypothetical protein
MKNYPKKKWNDQVEGKVNSLNSAKTWLSRMINDPYNDWDTQKSAHQALKFLELAEYEMWNMQWWENKKQHELQEKAENTIV